MSTTKAAPKINRKQTRAEVDGQIQKSIPTYLQADPWQCFEQTFGKHTLIESSKIGSFRAYQDYDQEQGEHPVQSGADPWQFFEQTFGKHTLIETSKIGSFRACQDYDQEQGEHPVQSGAMESKLFFVEHVPLEAKKAHSLCDICMYVFSLFANIAMVILGKLCSNHSEDSQALTGFLLSTIFNTPKKNRALLLKK